MLKPAGPPQGRIPQCAARRLPDEPAASLLCIGSAQGPYSPAVRCGNLLFVSGQVAIRPDGVSLGTEDLATQTRQCLANLRAVLEAAGASLDRVVKVTVYLADPDGWAVFNPIYAEAFGSHRPARSMVPVSAFPGGFKVEIDAIAVLAE
jgi:2-iminobutanoate/2-iminopropanoate deaminase